MKVLVIFIFQKDVNMVFISHVQGFENFCSLSLTSSINMRESPYKSTMHILLEPKVRRERGWTLDFI